MSTLPLLLECSTISRLCKSITPPPLSLSHPFHQRSNPSPHSSGQSPPCSPAHGKTTSLGRLGVVERKRTPPPPWGSCAELTDSPCLRLRFCLSAPRLPPCSEPFPVRNRAKRSAGLAEALHGRPKRAKAKEGREVHAPPTDPRTRLSSDDWRLVCEERSTRKQRGLCPDDPTTIAGGECWERSTVGYRVIVVLSASSSFDVVSPETENAI